ncbi:4-diphosphocytidyl-2C-methyl-D-erythritol kinase [Oleidesulfovibrio alaskensis G20]|jgi:4-diphosphocytidyl-2-C-methyl-D-erythritol kinase|uniref:4-diphosphocytidyl-2-C-methyl-D-erythritol kinase n=1 Tax=Oleidesulfovibrio alaskensis (strain ATCC BAA-1058 / DSM 17464 / G20) TaxID=207559 RepID=ISPE_OLEA2|nr:4-(cytidine 5'-diphospho)-2-C-methyl-D-erythritol kinase [Oleidesulfovibrio alaskensis]Q30ZH4.1 RecName: Full=4-diphosphocytidyl-2-C-methyl-D-erythritol kinase; Short=CMK; AltName: Full=4-(cytidine-5'-diphospho)-2-C-methyl-D-erythritol kinase [Oleidesulfovibrio alaskensis G20]ABB38922.1 4-diphosphocytidyl-2C-methyl-D-erythritol kinase [Oleidesulfovibrio alaskensis G20]MBG0772289.1 4-(cytidine 5'-diphospho)-2-C-methyl-D-erythritol kinase [Oleidesulfovibrio alaskensis]
MLTVPQQTIRSGCKINLFLEITGVRPDGYHELVTLFYPLSEPFDLMEISPATHGVTVLSERADLCGDKNIICKAWHTFAAAGGTPPPMQVRLAKGVPDGAGLGGGSANAAAVLKLLNTAGGAPRFSDTALAKIAAQVGADVPFFLHNTPCLATGIGEKLVPAPLDLSGWHLVLVCPGVQVSTPWAYNRWDTLYRSGLHHPCGQLPAAHAPAACAQLQTTGPDRPVRAETGCAGRKKNTCRSLTTERQADSKPVSRALWLFNSFETVVFSAYSELRQHKNTLLAHGASAALMSGSGSSLFGLFRDKAQAEAAMLHFCQRSIAVYVHRL